MAFDGTEGKFINITEAGDMTAAWRNGNNGNIKAIFFGKDKLQQLLDQPGTVGIRMYFGKNEEGENSLVLVSADADENDMETGKILDLGSPCPTKCGTPNPLNS